MALTKEEMLALVSSTGQYKRSKKKVDKEGSKRLLGSILLARSFKDNIKEDKHGETNEYKD